VVLGAGMAGLLAARSLADRVPLVTVVDRDELPAAPESRKGVPQGRHPHGLLLAGEQVLREMFPGLMEELVEGGAHLTDTVHARWWHYGGYRLGSPEAPLITTMSRPFLELAVRRRVRDLPNVRFLRARLEGLEADGGTVVGAVIRTDEREETLAATLTVDATGRGSQAPQWLKTMGFPVPAVSEVHADITYVTRLFERTAGRIPDGTFVATIDDPGRTGRVGAAFPIEGDRWILSLMGVHGDRAPSDDSGFLAFAETLPRGDIADIIRAEDPVGPIVTHRFPCSQWRHYEKLRRHPAGFLAIGDAICSFNPVYGQGMSTAALEAVALGDCVDRVGIKSDRLAPSFYKEAAKILATPWSMGAGGDFMFEKTTGDRPPMVNALNWYGKQAVIASQHDPSVTLALMRVQNLIAPSSSLTKPAMILKVALGARRGPTGAAAPTQDGLARASTPSSAVPSASGSPA
jgi:2-polyprenyl-6-methoxyphenol hydroxylase-like FAD-dependent oxidoreductase